MRPTSKCIWLTRTLDLKRKRKEKHFSVITRLKAQLESFLKQNVFIFLILRFIFPLTNNLPLNKLVGHARAASLGFLARPWARTRVFDFSVKLLSIFKIQTCYYFEHFN